MGAPATMTSRRSFASGWKPGGVWPTAMPASSGTAAARVEKRIVAETTYNREIAVRPQALAVAGWQVLNSSYSTSVATAESMSRLGADYLEA